MSFNHLYVQHPQVKKAFHPINVIQSGAHGIDELGLYQGLKAKKVLFIEADPINAAYAAKVLKAKEKLWCFKYTLINAALAETVKTVYIHRFNKLGGANSILPANPSLGIPKAEVDPHPVTTTTIDRIVAQHPAIYDTLVLDCQGSEGAVLQGAPQTLKNVQHAFVEIWKKDRVGYAGAMDVFEIDALLQDFERIATQWPSDPCAWGYAFYLRRK